MPRWWSERSSAARFDLYMRVSFYLNYAAVPPLVGLAIAPDEGALAAWVTGLLGAALALTCVLLIHRGIDHYLGKQPRPTNLIAITTLMTVAAVSAARIVYPGSTPDQPYGPADTIWNFALIMYVTAMATAVRPRVTVVLWAAASAATAVVTPDPQSAIGMSLLLGALAAAYRATVWMLGLFWEVDRARRLESKFAVAEERLRFARDLHDVVGRNLSVVALKSELAAQLAKRGRAEAVDEMLEVRQIAQDSLAELRAVVSGYREAALDVELAGARSLLTSAGIECRVVGDGSGLPGPVQGALGWVVREGTTNVLRHSEARTCTITLRPNGNAVTLTMDNDGVTDHSDGDGSGLVGLTERIAGLGGSVATERDRPDRFRLTVSLPLEETP
ncbi:sensor histidine kinase [Lentzea tibetensis]|uniref:Sensor histidine kinase n=1 Tax=Lentzea tibetensis TaxID=2591470 RepID=A0A563EGF3_9PSEU|nr:histidine kinase [Lentzea tibetensis]TWP43636.1 sensor histidine kinase [Lentzea tibetensis]